MCMCAYKRITVRHLVVRVGIPVLDGIYACVYMCAIHVVIQPGVRVYMFLVCIYVAFVTYVFFCFLVY